MHYPAFDAVADELGTTAAQVHGWVYKHSAGGWLDMSEPDIARLMRLHRNTISKHLRGLTAAGYLRTEHGPRNHRYLDTGLAQAKKNSFYIWRML